MQKAKTNGGDDMDTNALQRLLTPVSKVAILRALIDANGMPMNPRDIADTAGISPNAWYDNADDLLDLGAVEKAGNAGNSPLYIANPDDELVQALTRVYDVAAVRQRGGNPDTADLLDVPDELDASKE